MNNPRLIRKRPIPKDVVNFVQHSMDISKQILFILEKQGKDIAFLGEAMGLKKSEINKWMSGTYDFTLKTISKIEAVLNEPIIQCRNERLLKELDEWYFSMGFEGVARVTGINPMDAPEADECDGDQETRDDLIDQAREIWMKMSIEEKSSHKEEIGDKYH